VDRRGAAPARRIAEALLYSLDVASGKRTANPDEQLPRGRHGLPREAVTESQRRRILQAMIEVVAERGYPETRVVDVIGVAGVSRKTFYELFASKEDCFLATYDALVDKLLGDTARGFESKPGAPWAERVAAGLGALLEHLAEHPDEARFAIVEVLAAGPKALTRRDAALRQFTGFIDAGRDETPVELPGITSLSVAGGVNELLYSEILHGASANLPSRLPDLMFWITLPFLGPEGAADARERTRLSRLES
jgi:AcrR family transcriptional regulator